LGIGGALARPGAQAADKHVRAAYGRISAVASAAQVETHVVLDRPRIATELNDPSSAEHGDGIKLVRLGAFVGRLRRDDGDPCEHRLGLRVLVLAIKT